MKNLLPILLIILFISCAQKAESNQEPAVTIEHSDISVSDFNASIADLDSNTVILDVRTDAEFEAGIIPNAIQIDFMSPDFKDKASQLDPSKTYIVYCQAGGRSTAASKIMTKELGFTEVKNLTGGYSTWSKDN